MFWQMALWAPRWWAGQRQCWGIDAERRQLVCLTDLDQVVWQVSQPVLATPLFILLPLKASHNGQQRWWFCWHHWLSSLEYRRLLRAAWRWRHDRR